MPARRLTRSLKDAKLAGVCAGLADYLEVDVVLVRAAWLVLSIVPGAIIGGVLAYIAAWLVIPQRPPLPADTPVSTEIPGRRLLRSNTNKKIAGVCSGLGEYFGVDATAVRVLWCVLSILFGAGVGGVIAYLLAWFIIPLPSSVGHSNPVPAAPAA